MKITYLYAVEYNINSAKPLVHEFLMSMIVVSNKFDTHDLYKT